MTEMINNLEQDIAQTRARLDETIDQLQDPCPYPASLTI